MVANLCDYQIHLNTTSLSENHFGCSTSLLALMLRSDITPWSSQGSPESTVEDPTGGWTAVAEFYLGTFSIDESSHTHK